MDKEKLIKLLDDCATQMLDSEYSSWGNANTMQSFDDWRSDYTRSLINSCRRMIDELASAE